MAERNVRQSDLRHGLSRARSCRIQDNQCWKVATEDLDGDALTLVVALEGDVVVVTVF